MSIEKGLSTGCTPAECYVHKRIRKDIVPKLLESRIILYTHQNTLTFTAECGKILSENITRNPQRDQSLIKLHIELA